MKKIITLIVAAWATLASAQTADQFIAAGRTNLAQGNWWSANLNFSNAVVVSPTNETANALAATLRLLVLPQTPAGSNFLVALGFPATNRWMPHVPEGGLPQDTNGYPVFPANYNSTNLIWFFRTNVMAAVDASLTNLAAITHTNFTLTLASNETSITDVTVDYGDVQLLRAELWAVKFLGYTLNENNFGVVVPQVESWLETNGFTIQLLLTLYPNLGNLQSLSDLARSENALSNAIAQYFAASDFIRHRPANATNRLFELDVNDLAREAAFRADLTNALLSLNGPTEWNTNNYTSTVNAAPWFSGTHSLRSFLPQFDGMAYVNHSLPDYTFGGIMPYLPAWKTEAWLRHQFYSLAGIYGGGWSSYYGYGNLGIYVGTNRVATVLGSGSWNNGDSYGIDLQFALDPNGHWQFNSNNTLGVSGSGSLGPNGLNGELDFTNGLVAWLYGWRQPDSGPFQNGAGFYTGSYAGVQPGTLQAVMDANGDVMFVGLTNGVPSGGGSGYIDFANQFSGWMPNGTTLGGYYSPATFTISGMWTNPPYTGSFNLSRSASLPFDAPPVITANLPAGTNVSLGVPVTLALAVTASPPLCYQWYLNGDVIPFANGNTLVLSNNLLRSAGNYFISVTADNAVGETGDYTLVTVASPQLQLSLATGQPFTKNGFSFSLQAGSGVNGHIEVSTNLLNWTTLTNFSGNDGIIGIYDPAAANSPRRFYRAVVP